MLLSQSDELIPNSAAAGNRLALIHQSALDPLWNLEDLDLSNNQLTALDHRWFRKLEALQVLNLLHNPYR